MGASTAMGALEQAHLAAVASACDDDEQNDYIDMLSGDTAVTGLHRGANGARWCWGLMRTAAMRACAGHSSMSPRPSAMAPEVQRSHYFQLSNFPLP
uniref:Uncharacterized protein n=1 Tax=Zea mays TaxID=4577 RepID=A0A804P7G9_MAIZE